MNATQQNILSRDVGDGNLDCPACRVGATAELLRAVRAQENKRRRISGRSTAGFGASAMDERVEDGFLDPEANYTAFVEIIIPGGESASVGRDVAPNPRQPENAYNTQYTYLKAQYIYSVLNLLHAAVQSM